MAASAAAPSLKAAESKAVDEYRPLDEKRELMLEPDRAETALNRLTVCCRLLLGTSIPVPYVELGR